MYRLLRAVVMPIAAAGGLAVPATAQDLSLSGFFSQTVRGTQGDDDNDDDTTVASITEAGLTATFRSPATVVSVSPGVSLTLSDGDDPVRATPSLRGSLSHSGARTSVAGSLSVVPQFRSDRRFDTIFVTDPDGGGLTTVTDTAETDPLELRVSAGLSADHRLNTRDTAFGAVSAESFNYIGDSGGLDARRSFRGTAGLRRAFDQRTSGTLSTSVRQFFSDGDEEDSTTYSVQTGLSRQFNQRFNGRFNVGGTVVNNDDTTLVFSGGASLNYRMPNADFSLFAQQSVDQNDDGVVETVSSIGGALSYRINNQASAGVSGNVSFATPIDGGSFDDGTNTFSLGPRFNYALTARWRLTASYGLMMSDEGGGYEYSNRGLLRISRDFDLLR